MASWSKSEIIPPSIAIKDGNLLLSYSFWCPKSKGNNMDMQMCLSIIKNMPKEKLEVAKEIFIKMTAADGYIDSREKQLLELL